MQAPGPARGNYGYYQLRASPGMGRGAFALRNIPAGTTILRDKPLIVFNMPHSQITVNHINTAYQQLSPSDRAQFDAAPAFAIGGQHQLINPTPPDIFGSNQFSLDTDVWGCCVHSSRFNHSCLPNCDFNANSNGEMEGRTIKDVAAGEELTFAYVENFLCLPTDLRQILLQYHGLNMRVCLCSLCTTPEPARWASDMRRNLMRHLLYIWKRDDPAKRNRNDNDFAQNSGISLSQICLAGGALTTRFCTTIRFTTFARFFVKAAEEEGILSAHKLRIAYQWLAEVELRKPQPTVQDVTAWMLRERELKRICTPAGPSAESSEHAFDEVFNALNKELGKHGPKIP